mgnify:CR=1 FL=1
MKKILITIVFFPLFSFSQIISQYVETNKGSSPKGIEIYNNTGATLNFSSTNLTVWLEQNGAPESLKHTISSGTLAPNEVLVIGTSGMETDVDANNPNCEFYKDGDYIKLRTIRNINEGNELTAEYWLYDMGEHND